MIKSKKILIPACVLFALTEAWLGYRIQTEFSERVDALCYTSVILACVFFFLFAEASSSYIFTQLALLLTVGADYFLIHLAEADQLKGMLFFSLAQIAYFLRLFFEDKNKARRKLHLILRLTLSIGAVVLTCVVLRDGADAVAAVSMLYYANLILNLVFAFIQFEKVGVLAFGFLCFILCDTVIGLANIGPYIQIPEGSFIYKLLAPGFDPAWAFYVPSQALIAMSLLPERLKNITTSETGGLQSP